MVARAIGQDWIFAEIVEKTLNSWQYKVYAGLVDGIESGCRLKLVRKLARTLFRMFKRKELELTKNFSYSQRWVFHRNIRVSLPAYRRGFALF